MYAFFLQGVQVAGQGRHESFSFTGRHLGDPPPVQSHPSHDLHIKMAHLNTCDRPQNPAGCLPADRERLRQEIIKRLSLGKARAELLRLACQGLIVKRPRRLLKTVDLIDDGLQLFLYPVTAGAEYLVKDLVDEIDHGLIRRPEPLHRHLHPPVEP